MSFLAHIADRVLNQPLLLQPEKAAIIMEVLGGRIGVDVAQMSQFEGSPVAIGADGQARMMPFRVKDGVSIISVLGSLVGSFLVTRISGGIRSAQLQMFVPPQMTFITWALMIGMCVAASTLALMRIRKVEPGMVFR